MVLINQKTGLVEYFKKNLLKGYTEESLKIALINQGYSRSLIEKSLEQAHRDLAKKAPVLREKPVIKYEVLDRHDNLIEVKKSWWRRILRI